MRVYIYILAGLLSALIGWNLGQFFLTDLDLGQDFPEVILFPCIASSLACGMVMNEVFISNPTRPKLSWRIAKIPLLIAIGLGASIGLGAGGICQILFLPEIHVPPTIIRIVGWILIGFSVGLAEGLTWRWHSMEAGDRKRFWYRFKVSLISASTASFVAAEIFELIRRSLGKLPDGFQGFEDPLGFAILGLLLGLVFSVTNSPGYLAALRAGTGFEYTGFNYDDPDTQLQNVNQTDFPYIDTSILRFVTDSENKEIEEGLSIQLPGNGTIRIGSADKSHIHVPGLPLHITDLVLKHREALLSPNPRFFSQIQVNGQRLTSRRNIRLKHNDVLTFHATTTDRINQDGSKQKNIYRFIYYNRFLDPQA